MRARSLVVVTLVFAFVVFVVFGLVHLQAAEPVPPVKVGVIGLDNYQAVAFTQLWHDPKVTGDLAGIQVVAAFSIRSPDIDESVRELPKWTEGIQKFNVSIVDSVATLLKQVDAVLIMSVDRREHVDQGKSVLT